MRESTGKIALIHSAPMRLSLVLATVGTLFLGLLPNKSLNMAEKAGKSLAQTTTPGVAQIVTTTQSLKPDIGIKSVANH